MFGRTCFDTVLATPSAIADMTFDCCKISWGIAIL